MNRAEEPSGSGAGPASEPAGMADGTRLRQPLLVAAWPGMAHVGLNAAYYLMAKLQMRQIMEFSPHEMFDVEHVEVRGGLVQPIRLPCSRLYAWSDPDVRHDLVVFIGEAQPPLQRFAFCRRLLEVARRLGVQRVFTFAAMATRMSPVQESRVFGAATDLDNLGELQRLELRTVDDGHISGLNGVLLGAAREEGLPAACLLGEIPHLFAQLPFPKASLAVLDAFKTIAGLELDLTELSAHAAEVERQLGEVIAHLERGLVRGAASAETSTGEKEKEVEASDAAVEFAEPEPSLSEEERQHVEHLFELAQGDRARAFELKTELDRLGVFDEYEDRFLDLFRPRAGD